MSADTKKIFVLKKPFFVLQNGFSLADVRGHEKNFCHRKPFFNTKTIFQYKKWFFVLQNGFFFFVLQNGFYWADVRRHEKNFCIEKPIFYIEKWFWVSEGKIQVMPQVPRAPQGL
jgi:hypothetical protein